MDTTPYWLSSAPLPTFPALDQSVEVDVAIIGAGIVGLTAAYLLKKAGKSVAVIERDRCVRIDTGHTTAHVTAVTDLSRLEMTKAFGRDAARAVWDAGSAAIDQIVANIRSEDIACDFRWVPGYLHVPFDAPEARDREFLAREFEAVAALGIPAEKVNVPVFGFAGIQFPQQALFHPRKYLGGLLQTIPGKGSYIFEGTEAGEVSANPRAIRIGAHEVRCQYIVVATHNPLVGGAGFTGATLFQSKLALYTTYALGGKLPAGTLPEASYWDTAEPYNYLRVERHRDYDYAILGGEDHKTGQETDTTSHFQRLEGRFRRIAPAIAIDHRWSGQVIDTTDGLPFIGEVVEGQFAATGFAGNGMTFGALGGMMAADAVLGRTNPWRDLFDPGRKKIRGGTWTYLKENKDYPYFLLRDHLGGSEGKSLRALKRNQGKILNLDGRKVAAYRDSEGTVTLCSPVCTHLKCIVHWNDAEQTWDCPCHGSRFRPSGEVISGPAETPLERLPVPHE